MGQARIVAVSSQNHLGHIVGTNGKTIEFFHEVTRKNCIRRDFGHLNNLEPVLTAFKVMHAFKITPHGTCLFQRAHERQHELEVGTAVDSARKLEGFDFPVVNLA